MSTAATKDNGDRNSGSHGDPPFSERNDRETQEAKSLSLRYRLLLHVATLAIYIVPLWTSQSTSVVLDELHITAQKNQDINGPTDSWRTLILTLLSNDYWGRPMNYPSSHKSWRPLSVLSFRLVRGLQRAPVSWLTHDVVVHRLVNAVTHSAVSEMVGLLAVKLFPTRQPWPAYAIAKLAFALHPTHVEVTANAANRPHLMAVLCSVLACDANLPFSLFVVALAAGFLSCETFLFQTVPIAATLVIQNYYVRQLQGKEPREGGWGGQLRSLLRAIFTPRLLIRLILLATSAIAYYAGRLYFDSLSIPDGLIRPAENPFYEFTGWHRFRNYAYVLSIHLAKLHGLDFIGFSHEYGRECIRPIDDWRDVRLLVPLAMAGGLVSVFLYLLIQQRQRSILSKAFLLFSLHLAWMSTLFPISGIIKVGTFIADRIVVASTVSVSILLAYVAGSWVGTRYHRRQKLLLLALVAAFSWRRVHNRTLDWMDSLPLLESSLKTCPRFAKAHLEMSKIYSGLYPGRFNLTQSRWHLEQIERIDPDFCDVHQKFAHVAIQEHKYNEFEERLTKSLLCPFTAEGSTALWKQYWTVALDETQNAPAVVEAAKKRYDKFMAILGKAIEEEKVKGERQKSSSPLVAWSRDEL